MSKEKIEYNANPVGATSTPRACISCSSFHFTQLIDSRPHFEGIAKKQTGITLIALIITIIVMLILVGVTVNVALNGGLFNTTRLATEETKMQAEKEMLLAETIAAYDAETGMIDEGKLRTNLEAARWTVETENGQTVYISPSNKKYTVGQNFEVAYIGDVVEESVKHLDDDNNPLTIGSIEDLVDLSIAVNEGTTYEGETVTLLTSLDFDNPESYRNSEDTSYGDINGNGTAEPIITELTTSLGFMPIGKIIGTNEELGGIPVANSFGGTFEGNGKTISNLYINRPTESAALFGAINTKATIKNLTIKNQEVYGIYASGLAISLGFPEGLTEENMANYMSDVLTIENCHTKGGKIGAVNDNCISQCSSGVLLAPLALGTIDIKESSNSSTISGIASAGITYSMGFGQVEIKKCNNYGDIIIDDADKYSEDDNGEVAGCAIAATQSGVKIDECFNYGTLNATAGTYFSGLIVGSSVSISNSSNYGILNYSGGDYVTISGIYLDPGYDIAGEELGKIERTNNYGDINVVCVNATACEIGGITTCGGASDIESVSECLNKGNINISGELRHSSANSVKVAGIDSRNNIISDCINYGNINFNLNAGCTKYISGISYAGSLINKCINYGNIDAIDTNNSTNVSGISSDSPKIVNCANYGNLTGYSVAGITYGKYTATKKKVYNCYNRGDITVYSSSVSAGIGYCADIKNSYSFSYSTGNATEEQKQEGLTTLNANIEEDAETPWSEWKIDPNINNGYPVFSWQQAEE